MTDLSAPEQPSHTLPPDIGAVGEPGEVCPDTTLADLLSGRGLSARLEAMLASTRLGTMTVGEYLTGQDEVVAWMLAQKNCGRKTTNELAIVVAEGPLPAAAPLTPPPEPPAPAATIAELLSADQVSARLAEALGRDKLQSMGVGEYLTKRQEVEQWMLRLPNCGRRSVRELAELVGMHLRLHLGAVGRTAEEFGPEFAAFVAAGRSPASDGATPPDGCDLRSMLEWHLARLPERTADIIARRFGLHDGAKWTLAEIGDDMGVTRERIRQIEAKGLRAMSAACRRFPIKPLVAEATPALLETVLGGRAHATYAEAERTLAGLDGWTELGLLLSHGGTTQWLAASARKLGDGWLLRSVDPAEVRAVAKDLKRGAAKRPFPRTAAAIVGTADGILAAAAIDLIRGWRTEAGYVFDRRPGPRLRRTARLHALLAEAGDPLEMVALLRLYSAAIPDDPCSDRDLVIVMEAATHLFLEIYEGCWVAIGDAAPPPAAEPRHDDDEATPTAREREEGTNASALEDELERVGPCRMGELMNRALDILPKGRSRHSIGPTLLCNPSRFVRVIPGVYALPHQVLDGRELVQAGAVEYLLNPTQARFYAVGRKAGERWGAYPLWTPTAEMRLCRWARAGDDRELHRSLLDVASIEDWPTDEADKEVWRELKERDGRFELWAELRRTGGRPPLERVLAAAIRLSGAGSLGWVGANRILGYVPSSYAGAGLLSGMVAAGLAKRQAIEHGWQLPHTPGPDLDAWVLRLVSDLHETGAIDWDEGSGPDLARAFALSAEVGDVPLDEHEELDEFESIMAEHRRSMQARRIEARLELEAE